MLITHRIEQHDLVQLKDLLEALDLDATFGLVVALLVVVFTGLLLLVGRLVSRGDRLLKRKTILEQLFRFRSGQRSFSKFGLVLSFYQIFVMFSKMLLGNSIKVSTNASERFLQTPFKLLFNHLKTPEDFEHCARHKPLCHFAATAAVFQLRCLLLRGSHLAENRHCERTEHLAETYLSGEGRPALRSELREIPEQMCDQSDQTSPALRSHRESDVFE